MATVHTILDSIPPARSDGVPWNRAQLGQAADPAGPWTVAATITLSPLDSDPLAPATRDLTFSSSLAVGYFRIIWLDAAGNQSVPTAAVYDDGVSAAPPPPAPSLAPPGKYTSVALLKAFTSIPSLQAAADALLANNIIPRAEAWVDAWGPFTKVTCPQLGLGANILAEFIFEMNNPARREALYGAFKSESIGDYSYTLNDIVAADPERFQDLLNEVAILIDACLDIRTMTPPVAAGSTRVFAAMTGYETDPRTGRLTSTFDLSQETRFIRSWLETLRYGEMPIYLPPGSGFFAP